MQVGAVQGPAEHPVNPGVVGVQESLGGDAVCNEPNTQEKQEEENIFHLQGRNTHPWAFFFMGNIPLQL